MNIYEPSSRFTNHAHVLQTILMFTNHAHILRTILTFYEPSSHLRTILTFYEPSSHFTDRPHVLRTILIFYEPSSRFTNHPHIYEPYSHLRTILTFTNHILFQNRKHVICLFNQFCYKTISLFDFIFTISSKNNIARIMIQNYCWIPHFFLNWFQKHGWIYLLGK